MSLSTIEYLILHPTETHGRLIPHFMAFPFLLSYLHYGLLAVRAEILKARNGSGNPCILAGFDGSYRYGGKDYSSSASSSGSSFGSCRLLALRVLDVSASCTSMGCTFGGIWNGRKGDGRKNIFAASFFFDMAVQVGLVERFGSRSMS